MRSGAKKAVVWTCGLGIILIVGATVASWDALAERYWIWKLEEGDATTALAAAQELSRRQSLRAVRPLIRRIRATSTEAASGCVGGRLAFIVGAERNEPDVAEYTDVYLPPFALCLHGIGPSVTSALDPEIEALETELPVLGESGAAVGRARREATRTLHVLRCVRHAWRDEKVTVHVEMPVQNRQMITF